MCIKNVNKFQAKELKTFKQQSQKLWSFINDEDI
jgi:hypothetical protein